MKDQTASKRETPAVGLCAECANARRIASSRGSEFLLCELSRTDPHFAKYPRLPVLRCDGYEKAESRKPE